ncbi:MAG: hypothetical protein COV44_10300 [Deltaproteobacteria bacterium CG11_big_fil_rev_8_21_14_0_20_45_16]|nr:MAG: hypothetical protein COV44_10300 [Deltaproteobacteria bacterium CG11_big_fil_rev_8_21_14_0_20_45_16]
MKAIRKKHRIVLILSLLSLAPITGQNIYAQEANGVPPASDGPGWVRRPIDLESIAAYRDLEDKLKGRTPFFPAVYDPATGYMPARLLYTAREENPEGSFRYGVKEAPDGALYAYVEIDGYGEFRIGDLSPEPELIAPHHSMPVVEPNEIFPLRFSPNARLFPFPHPKIPGWNRYFLGLSGQPNAEGCVMLLVDVARNY